jgi:hypothetical protein
VEEEGGESDMRTDVRDERRFRRRHWSACPRRNPRVGSLPFGVGLEKALASGLRHRLVGTRVAFNAELWRSSQERA